MYRRILIGGVTAAVIVGAGGAALATTGSQSTNGSPSATGTHAKTHNRKHAKGRRLLRRLDHAQVTVHTKKGFVTRELIRGTVTQVSASSITVTSAGHATDTFSITKDTKVATRSDGKRKTSSIGSVSNGDHVFVGGVGAGTPVARHVFDRGSK